ncbi:uncharacterized protein TNIN_394351 [Trichonephila inaurata madagascariensis]|uniref:Uncharacterized protein n=1 Tax=Trichonephila inaurata madagascariensis TaxID=2747483 RepID=A0A8X6Y873_9ARAC|nr:uncharacterized protein TNIN_394351 [Trichonephila inaurata madagascariensis]
MSALGLSLGTAAHGYVDKEDSERVMISDARAHGSTREGRMALRQHQLNLLEATDTSEGPSNGRGIDDIIIYEISGGPKMTDNLKSQLRRKEGDRNLRLV